MTFRQMPKDHDDAAKRTFQDPSGVFPKPAHKSPAFPVARFTRLGFPVDAAGGGV